MFILVFLLAQNVAAQTPPLDTCAMAAQSIHTFTAHTLVRSHFPIVGQAANKAKVEIARDRVIQAVHNIKFSKMKNAAMNQVESQFFHSEPSLFTAYRVHKDINPCDQLDSKIKKVIEENQTFVKKTCLGNSNPYASIKYSHHAWSSEAAIQEGLISMFTACSPNQNSRSLFLKHQVANAYDVSADRLCRAAWSGLKEAWSEYKYCQSKMGWVDLNAWTNGEIKRVPAQE
tara:strand:- start:3168 stop:3857 length:690 start_codon:yes stop_codon:yes gene_type:complete